MGRECPCTGERTVCSPGSLASLPSFVPLRSSVRPVCGGIDSAQGIDEIAEQSVPTVCHRINLFVPRRKSFHGPLKIGMMAFRADGFVEESPLRIPRAFSNPATRRRTVCSLMTSSFSVASAPCFHILSRFSISHVFLNLWVQKFSARFIANVPYLFESRRDVGCVYRSSAASFHMRRIAHLYRSKLPSDRVPVHAGHEAEVVDDLSTLSLYLSSVPPRRKMFLKYVLFGRHVHMAPR